MSFTIINGKQIELLDLDDRYVSKKNTLIADINGVIYLRPYIIRKKTVLFTRNERIEIISILGKRTSASAFGEGQGDEERYGQKIDTDFFCKHIGHNVYPDYS